MGVRGDQVRFVGLDGMRGVAAIVVMLHHVVPRLTGIGLLRSGYLAVDFFFMLSGLVIALAWDERLHGGGALRRFAVSRGRRVAPVMALGIVAGAVVALLGDVPPARVAVRLVAHLTLVPEIDGTRGIFPLDGVEWSLLFELFANALYALVLVRLPTGALVAIAAAGLAVLAWLSDPVIGVAMGDRGSNVLGGFPRVVASYTIGVLLFRALRAGWRPPGLSYPVLLAALVAALICPGCLDRESEAGLFDLATITLVFPALILATTAARVGERGSRWAALGAAVSFPLYAIHLPVLDAASTLAPTLTGLSGVAVVGSLALTAALALAIGTGPVRLPALRLRRVGDQPLAVEAR